MTRSDITYQDKINELRLDISHPNSTGINFIFVEGVSDIKFFRKFFDLEKSKVEYIPGGKTKLEECVFDLGRTTPLIIGIRDADFLHLSDTTYLTPNIFLTDFHDIEMTMLSHITILNALFFEYTDIEQPKHAQFRDEMMESIKLIGYLKWLNNIDDLELNFSVGFHDLISFGALTIDFTQYLQRVLSKSKNAKIKEETIIRSKMENLALSNPDLMQLTNGHDLLNTLAKYFRENTNRNKSVTDEIIASSLRMTFTMKQFETTNLYQQLNDWRIKNNTALFANNS